jgi:glyoxylase-like metal-dependent hydrolase (beta-lactamase superfamily II)
MSASTYRFDIGRFECLAVSDLTGMHDYTADQHFPSAPPRELAPALARHGLAPEHIPSPFSGLVVNTGTHIVLIDTGVGAIEPGTGLLQANLRAVGVQPEDVDTVILTHAHPDHVGGNTDAEGQIVFARARYVLMRDEWQYWTSAACEAHPVLGEFVPYIQKNLLPLRDRLDLLDGAGAILPGIQAVPTPGHTPGHMAVAVTSRGEALIHAADAALHPIHLEHPDWCPIFDTDPLQAVTSKRALFDRAAAERALVLASHFAPFPSLGHVERRGNGWEWQPARVAVQAPAAASRP